MTRDTTSGPSTTITSALRKAFLLMNKGAFKEPDIGQIGFFIIDIGHIAHLVDTFIGSSFLSRGGSSEN